ncbi:DUF4134 domain-containing protein [Pontibacter korlensis]|uniref:Conjugal transfer protein n=2 Tax=Pontibacter korlensis TaxID=400092 RepID=A0A0E3ZCX1_9BACT|nr:conjugal transfer protein [Pontibacter korlensis]
MKKFTTIFFLALLSAASAFGQGAAGIDAGASELQTYIDPVGNLILIVGAIVGLIGGVRVYIKWNSGDQDTQKAVMGWMGSCVFLMVVGVVIKAFFGV